MPLPSDGPASGSGAPEDPFPLVGPSHALLARREALQAAGSRLVLTNGCFDLLHSGHLTFLRAARNLGDALWVGLNSDASVQALKGPTRPVQNERERALALLSLRFVDAVFVFSTPRLTADIEQLRPDLYAKAGDYTLETLDPGERSALVAAGTRIHFLPFLPGFSTTRLIARIREAADSF